MPKTPTRFWGIDGEGKGRKPHRYTLLAASDETGRLQRYVEDENGLDTVTCLDFLLSLTQSKVRYFTYSFTYDLTKILRDVDNETIYRLLRPETRTNSKGKIDAIYWGEYRLNLIGQKLTISKGKRKVVIWDCWRFFGGKFTSALKQWKINVDVDSIEALKEKRGEFEEVSPIAIRRYCLSECTALAQLMRKVDNAHIKADIPLTSYHGAGSTASVLLNQMGIKQLRDPGPAKMQEAIASAFFGGRFEIQRAGSVTKKVYSYDISSAYPYQLTFLPCLIHSRWTHTKKLADVEKATAACVRYQLGESRIELPWGPFPFRQKDGTIIFPIEGGTGWVWRDEFLQGARLFPNVEFREAWVLRQRCDCQPFARIPEIYRERLRIGKEGPGIVLKLGPNSVYGKLAQSIGLNPPYQSWIWAGMVTSGCRAQLLEIMGLHSDWLNMLMTATDGIYSTEEIDLPIPKDTGTSDLGKPLGGWETDELDDGVFIARPGVYFPLGMPDNPSDEELAGLIAEVKGRGVGKKTILKQWRRVVTAFERGEHMVSINAVERFCGAKTCVYPFRNTFKRSPDYGEWKTRDVQLSFDPSPKRQADWGAWRIPLNAVSQPYRTDTVSPEAAELKRASLEADEQP